MPWSFQRLYYATIFVLLSTLILFSFFPPYRGFRGNVSEKHGPTTFWLKHEKSAYGYELCTCSYFPSEVVLPALTAICNGASRTVSPFCTCARWQVVLMDVVLNAEPPQNSCDAIRGDVVAAVG